MDKKALKAQKVDQKKQQEAYFDDDDDDDYDDLNDEELPPYTSGDSDNNSSDYNDIKKSKRKTTSTTTSRTKTDPSSKYPPQAHHTQVPIRSFKIKPRNWTTHNLQVLDANKPDEVLYTAKPKFMSSSITIKKGPLPDTKDTTNSATATANLAESEYHVFRRTMDITMHGQTITIKLKSGISTKTTLFPLPALQNSRVTWRNENHLRSSELTCWDEQSGLCLAKITSTWWNLRGQAEFDLYGEELAGNEMAVDEIVATGLTILHHILRRRRAAAARSAGGGGGG